MNAQNNKTKNIIVRFINWIYYDLLLFKRKNTVTPIEQLVQKYKNAEYLKSIILKIKHIEGKEKIILFGSNIFSLEPNNHPYINQIKNALDVGEKNWNEENSYLHIIKSLIKNEIEIRAIRIYFDGIENIKEDTAAIKSTTDWGITNSDALRSVKSYYPFSPIASFDDKQFQKQILEHKFEYPFKINGDTFISLECHRDMIITIFF